MLRKIIIALIFCVILSSCCTGYEYMNFSYKPCKVEKKEKNGITFFKIKFYSDLYPKKYNIVLSEFEYNELTNYGKKDVMTLGSIIPCKIKIDYN